MAAQQFLENAMVGTQDENGLSESGHFFVSHRDTNTFLTINMGNGSIITTKPGVMVAMSPSVNLKGAVKFSMKKFLTGGQMAVSTFTGPGELLLTPSGFGDIKALHLNGHQQWFIGKDAFLASTKDILKETKSQGLGKAFFSGEGLFVYIISGSGTIWVSSFGAIVQKQLQPNETYIVDNGHLVAWNMQYTVERVASGGLISNLSAGEGLVCKFTGPGTVLLQSKNPSAFAGWLSGYLPTQ